MDQLQRAGPHCHMKSLGGLLNNSEACFLNDAIAEAALKDPSAVADSIVGRTPNLNLCSESSSGFSRCKDLCGRIKVIDQDTANPASVLNDGPPLARIASEVATNPPICMVRKTNVLLHLALSYQAPKMRAGLRNRAAPLITDPRERGMKSPICSQQIESTNWHPRRHTELGRGDLQATDRAWVNPR